MPKKFMDSICLLAILPLETGQGAGKTLWSLLLGNMVQSRRQRSKLWFYWQRRKGFGSTKEGQKTPLKKFPIWFWTYRACPLCSASFTSSLSWAKIQTLAAYRYPEEHFYQALFTPSPTHFSQESCGPSGCWSRPSADPLWFHSWKPTSWINFLPLVSIQKDTQESWWGLSFY